MKDADQPEDWVRELETIMATLRTADGCPWDREQSHITLKKYLVEEAYELIDAIDSGSDGALAEELGDVLLQIVFHCQIALEDNRFDLQKVAQICCEKLIRRHPHVFGDTSVETADDVVKQWEQIKAAEKTVPDKESVLDGVPSHLPALMRAEKVQKKAAKVGFDWTGVKSVLQKVEEELHELEEGLERGDQQSVDDEIGDLLFSVVNLSRFCRTSPEEALRGTIDRFYRRFQIVEQALREQNREFSDCTLADLDVLWDQAKKADDGNMKNDVTAKPRP